MAHPRFKTQLFRFVDVFPACHDDADVLRHLEEYFDGVEMPRALRLGLGLTERVPFGAGISAAAARRNVRRMARQLIVGAAPEDALPRLERLWRAGEASTVDLLGEHIVTEAEADRYAARVTAMLEALVSATRTWPAAPLLERDPWGLVPRVNVSVKPTALTPLFAPPTAAEGLAEAERRLRPVLERARAAGATIHLDTEHDEAKDLTFELLRALGAAFPDGPQLGCVVQAYRKDAYADLRLLVDWSRDTLHLPLHIRLVKGAYWDSETIVADAEGWPVPVFETKAETDANYERCTRYLLDHAGEVRPAFGSHNVRSLAYAIAYTRARGLPETAVELQLLYGMAEPRRPGPRTRLVAAVRGAPPAFEAPVLIEGTPVPTTDLLTSVDPGEFATAVCRAGRAGPAEAERAVDAALRALPAWRATSWRERAATLFRAAAILRSRRTELAALEVFEAAKPLAEADADVCEAIDYCEYYGRQALRLGDGAPVRQRPGETNLYRYQPRGVGAVIAPWNFPLAIPAGMVTASLVAGNCVVFKPAEQAPGVAFRLVEILLEAGVPPGALAFLPGMGDVGAHLVRHPAVAFVVFTGSKAVGLSIIADAAVQRPGQRHLKPVIAEMGGKNAIVVDSDADLDQAVPAIVASAFAYAGQKCSAASRVIGVGPVFEPLVERLAGAAAVVPVGHARELRTVVGPLIDEDAYRRVRDYRALARQEGEVVYQRDEVPAGGWYVGPTVVVTRDPRARIATEEIFGPLLTVLRADDFEHALALANDTAYALTGGLFSRSPVHIRRAADEFRAGNLYVNRAITGARVGRQPFGGYGLSGVGSKAGGPDYLLQFVEPRTVTENTIRQGFAPVE